MHGKLFSISDKNFDSAYVQKKYCDEVITKPCVCLCNFEKILRHAHETLLFIRICAFCKATKNCGDFTLCTCRQ